MRIFSQRIFSQIAMKTNNPFKFGSVVDDSYFTDRKNELNEIKQALDSKNHLILISPRRFGKTSLILKSVKNLQKNYIYLDLQLTNSVEEFVSQYLKKIYKLFPAEKIKAYIKNFRILPQISLNPTNNELDVSFKFSGDSLPVIEDVLNLLEQISTENKRTIVILDEFQEINQFEKGFDKKLRAIIQHHKNINYVFLGSQESLMKYIFENKKSAFYHFGQILQLQKIKDEFFINFLNNGFATATSNAEFISKQILLFTQGHPYYTQQLAYNVWNLLYMKKNAPEVVSLAINETILSHDYDFERLWNTLNLTDRKTLIHLLQNPDAPFLHQHLNIPTSTLMSSIKRLLINGFIIKNTKGYEIDDPFFKQWLLNRRKKS